MKRVRTSSRQECHYHKRLCKQSTQLLKAKAKAKVSKAMGRQEQERALEVQARDFMERRAKARMGKARAKASPTWPTYSATDVARMVTCD